MKMKMLFNLIALLAIQFALHAQGNPSVGFDQGKFFPVSPC